MSCLDPRIAYQAGNNENGKKNVRFAPIRFEWSINEYRKRYGDSLFLMPCGKCLGCQLDKARDWSIRCVLESQYHTESCFVTLTFDDAHYPVAASRTTLRDLFVGFIESLRNDGVKCRYFGCCERGSITKRIHAHIIIFGFKPDDMEFYKVGSNGDYLYNSAYLSSKWQKGFVVVGDMSYQSAGYVARYTMKKLDDDSSFIFMSNRPGIGFQYCKDHAEKIIESDCVYGQFGNLHTAPVPRYFNRFLSEWYPEQYARLQLARIRNISLHDNNALINYKKVHLEQLKIEQEKALNKKAALLKRGNV